MKKHLIIFSLCLLSWSVLAQRPTAKVLAIDPSARVNLEVFLPGVFKYISDNTSLITIRFQPKNKKFVYTRTFSHTFSASQLIRNNNDGRLKFKKMMPMGNFLAQVTLSESEQKFRFFLNTGKKITKLFPKKQTNQQKYNNQIRTGEVTTKDYMTSKGKRTQITINKLQTEQIATLWLLVLNKNSLVAQYFGEPRASWTTTPLPKLPYQVFAIMQYKNGTVSKIQLQ